MLQLPKDIDLVNPEFLQAWNLLRNTHQSVFLTGKAGTGKSTFLSYICAHIKKKFVVLAPTGIAAMNVGGMTLHSFFQMPMRPVLPNDPDYSGARMLRKLKYNKEKLKLMRELDLVIIDEISMVRADMIDFIDRVLRTVRRKRREPFGGCQLLLVGDIFQLEPVVTTDTRTILSYAYSNFFFFNAKVYSQIELVAIELKKIYRQKNRDFVAILDRVRENRTTEADLNLINSRYSTTPQPTTADSDKISITLAAYRDTVDYINNKEMELLPGDAYIFHGEITDDFPDKLLPTDKELTLKKGAQVILIKNDPEHRWVNGSLAIVHDIDSERIKLQLEAGDIYDVEPMVWENVRYTYNEQTHRIAEDVIGTFTQFPVKAAWAMTIHKSQGLTFDNIIIDLERGAFTGGQTYVALSRCTSLEGITLHSRISKRDILVNPEIVRFSRCFNSQTAVEGALNSARADLLYAMAIKAFKEEDYLTAVNDFYKALTFRNEMALPNVRRLVARKLAVISEQRKRIEALEQERRRLAAEYVDMGGECLASGSELWEPALANFRKALHFDAENLDAGVGEATALFVGERFDDALMAALKIAASHKKNIDALLIMTRCYMHSDDLSKALMSCNAALKLRRKDPEIHLLIADIYDRLDMPEQAEEHKLTAAKLRKKKK